MRQVLGWVILVWALYTYVWFYASLGIADTIFIAAMFISGAILASK